MSLQLQGLDGVLKPADWGVHELENVETAIECQEGRQMNFFHNHGFYPGLNSLIQSRDVLEHFIYSTVLRPFLSSSIQEKRYQRLFDPNLTIAIGRGVAVDVDVV
jgi:hypothetical protein